MGLMDVSRKAVVVSGKPLSRSGRKYYIINDRAPHSQASRIFVYHRRGWVGSGSPFPIVSTADIFVRTKRAVPEQPFLGRGPTSAAAAADHDFLSAVVFVVLLPFAQPSAIGERPLQVGDVLFDVQQHLSLVRRLGRRLWPRAEQRRRPVPTAVRRGVFNVQVDGDL